MPGGRGGNALEVSGAVLEKAWKKSVRKIWKRSARNKSLEAAVLEHLAAAGNNFARSLAEFKKANGGIDAIDNPFESGSVLENAWAIVASELDGRAHAEFFENIEKGDLEEVQLYMCVGVNVKDMCALYKGGSERPLH